MKKGLRKIFMGFVITPAVMQLSVLIALESACPAATLRLEVIKTLPYPNIGSTTPGVEQFPGGFEGGSTAKVKIHGKTEYHFFATAMPTLGWGSSSLDHWVGDGHTNWHRVRVEQPTYKDKDGNYQLFCAATPFFNQKQNRWYLYYGRYPCKIDTWQPNGVIAAAPSKTSGMKGIRGPFDFPGQELFVPGVSYPAGTLSDQPSPPYQLADGNWAVFMGCDGGHSTGRGDMNYDAGWVWSATDTWPKGSDATQRPGHWWVAPTFGPTPLGPFTNATPFRSAPLIAPGGFNENPMPLRIRGPKTGKDYWVAVFDFLAPETAQYPEPNVFGFCWSEDGINWPKEHGQVVKIDEGLPKGQKGWWKGQWAVRCPHQMIDEGDGTYTIFFTGATTENYFAGFRAVGSTRVRVIEE